MKFIAIIPARLKSSRFPNKILHSISSLPMIEHVRRRAIQAIPQENVYVATCDMKIAELVKSYGGNVLLTNDSHKNGTSRIAEACSNIDCTHILLLQGDEPLLMPDHIHRIVQSANENQEVDVWNATGELDGPDDLLNESHVKCCINKDGKILYCFRKSPFISPFELQKVYVRKLFGIFMFRKDFLLNLVAHTMTDLALSESIEQLGIIEIGGDFQSLDISPNLPSVNLPEDLKHVEKWLREDITQKNLLELVFNYKVH